MRICVLLSILVAACYSQQNWNDFGCDSIICTLPKTCVVKDQVAQCLIVISDGSPPLVSPLSMNSMPPQPTFAPFISSQTFSPQQPAPAFPQQPQTAFPPQPTFATIPPFQPPEPTFITNPPFQPPQPFPTLVPPQPAQPFPTQGFPAPPPTPPTIAFTPPPVFTPPAGFTPPSGFTQPPPALPSTPAPLFNIFNPVNQGQFSLPPAPTPSPPQTTPAPVPVNVCDLPPVTGHCGRARIMWFFDAETRKCERFSFSGCGNGNRFVSKSACLAKCGNI